MLIVILYKPSVLFELPEILGSFLIDPRVIFACTRFKVYFRLDYSLSPASARASSALSTAYGRDSTFSTNSFGGLMPLKGFIVAMIIVFYMF